MATPSALPPNGHHAQDDMTPELNGNGNAVRFNGNTNGHVNGETNGHVSGGTDETGHVDNGRTTTTTTNNHHHNHNHNHNHNSNSNGRPNGAHNGNGRTRSHREEWPSVNGGIPHTRSHRIQSFGPHQDDIADPQNRIRAHIRSYADDARARLYPRISKPVELMRSSYDCVVIGSGYGGAVAASRMARAVGPDDKRPSVCVLERGQERWPGEYPSKFFDAVKDLHMSGEFKPGQLPGVGVDGGDPTGMYHLIFGQGMNAVVGNGLGGTSLMNANVFLEPDKDTMSLPFWPPEIRNHPERLTQYYQMASEVLEPTEYPDDWPRLPKVELLKRQAKALGMEKDFKMVPQTTRFRNGPNSCGVEMLPSALTGQDATGLNDGSKTTTLVTYLADAWNWGAEMFCECEVRYVEKATDRPDGGYIIYFAWHGRNRGHFQNNLHQDLMWVHAKECVFLGAGSIGSTEILLRSRDMGLDLSDRIGTNMSGNGDMLAFGYNTDYEANSVGKPHTDPYNPTGPTINSMIDRRWGHENPLDGYVIEEGAIPSALTPFLQLLMEHMPGRVAPTDQSYAKRARSKIASWGSWLFGPSYQSGAMDNTQVYLIMSHDSCQAALTLKNDKPVLEFLGVGRSDHVNKLNDILAKATDAVGGTFVQNPFSALMGKSQITVHPIGGACMASDSTGDTGVTNHMGEVFVGNTGETHDGLIVTDAAVIPTALGVNPFATITALAERSVRQFAAKRGYRIYTRKNKILNLFGEPQYPHGKPIKKAAVSTGNQVGTQAGAQAGVTPGIVADLSASASSSTSASASASLGSASSTPELSVSAETIKINDAIGQMALAKAVKAYGFGFTEVMSGNILYDTDLVGDTVETYQLAFRRAQRLCETARFFLSVQSLNTESLVRDVDHAAMLTGTFACPTIPGSPFMVHRGEFNLFVVDDKAPGSRNMTYDCDLRGVDGRLLHFHGYKVVDSSVALAPWQFWKATSTLYVTVTEPSSEMENYKDDNAWRRQRVLAKGIMRISPADFGSQVLTMSPTGANLVKKAMSAATFFTYFTRKSLSLFLAPMTPLQYPSVTYTGYINDTPPTDSWVIEADDGVRTKMHMWEPEQLPSGRVPLRNLLMVPGASVDHQIFALPTIPYNAVNYFTRAGYRVFISVHRIGQLVVAQNNWTTFDARRDIRACLDVIRGDEFMADNCDGNRVYVIAHCMGSVALSAGMLDGTVPSDWVAGVTASQVFMNPLWGPLNMAKVLAGPLPLDRLYGAMAGSWFSLSTSHDDSWVQRALNQLLRLYPDFRREICNNACCHRCSLVFGRLWNHSNLNEATHRQTDRFFGGVNMTLLRMLMRQGYSGHVMDNDFSPLTRPANLERLRGVPIMCFVGADNAVLSPESTSRTFETLCSTFGSAEMDRTEGMIEGENGNDRGHQEKREEEDVNDDDNWRENDNMQGGDEATLNKKKQKKAGWKKSSGGVQYRRRVVPGYGHLDCWMGRNAWKDVFPFVREEVDRVTRGEDYRFEEPNDKFARMVQSGGMLY